jgi:hypothetical protein
MTTLWNETTAKIGHALQYMMQHMMTAALLLTEGANTVLRQRCAYGNGNSLTYIYGYSKARHE